MELTLFFIYCWILDFDTSAVRLQERLHILSLLNNLKTTPGFLMTSSLSQHFPFRQTTKTASWSTGWKSFSFPPSFSQRLFCQDAQNYETKSTSYLSPHPKLPGSLPTSRRLASFLRYLVNRWHSMLAQQQATCTSGPSFPKLSPEETAKTRVMVLMMRVHFPR